MINTTLLNQKCLAYLRDCAQKLRYDALVVAAGVYRGGDIVTMASVRPDLRFIAIDSFNGLAEPSDNDICKKTAMKGECNAGGIEIFLKNTKGIQVDAFPCWIPSSEFNNISVDSQIDMLWLDLDHYEPTKAMLNKFLKCCSDDAIIITHDYGFERTPGIKKACDKFGKWAIETESIAKMER